MIIDARRFWKCQNCGYEKNSHLALWCKRCLYRNPKT